MRRLAAFALLTVLMSVGAAACSSSTHEHAASAPTSASASASASASTATLPGNTSPEAGFARDMSVHHSQAVAMAEAIRDRTTDADLKILATNIALGQQAQIGRMSGWLDEWGLTQTSTTPAMAWIRSDNIIAMDTSVSMPGMDMTSGSGTPGTMVMGADGRMPGMATRPEVSALSTLPIADAEVSFLRLMIAHHRAGVDMAGAVLARSARPDVVQLATSIVNGQESEIALMTAMLAKRGATP